jgi:hypothetical protein
MAKPKPIITNNPKDKRIQNYKDSLDLYNLSYSQAKDYFKQPNPDKDAKYNKKEAVERMNYDKIRNGGLQNSNRDKGQLNEDKAGKKMTAIQKRTGYLPIGQRYLGEGSNYIFKKPVQPVVYKKDEAPKPAAKPVAKDTTTNVASKPIVNKPVAKETTTAKTASKVPTIKSSNNYGDTGTVNKGSFVEKKTAMPAKKAPSRFKTVKQNYR